MFYDMTRDTVSKYCRIGRGFPGQADLSMAEAIYQSNLVKF